MKKTLDNMYRTMPWGEIDSIVFDVGNVLISPGFDGIFSKYSFSNPSEIYKMTFGSPYWIMLDEGTITMEEAIENMIGFREDLRSDIDFVMHHWIEYKNQMEEGVFVAKQCYERKKRLVVLSNYADCYFSYLEKHFDVFNLFDYIIVSARVRLLKPNPEIFKYTEKTCGLIAERTLLIDDSSMNCKVAMDCGWNAVCFNIPGKLKAFFQ